MSAKSPAAAGTSHSLPSGKSPRTHTKKSNGKTRTKPSDDAQRKIEMEQKIRKRVALEEKAFRLVEKLLENPITEEFLIEAGLHITPEHYQDVVEERSISSNCGYPICSKPLKNVSKQKYHISTTSNKVYDITDRKKYCSNQCYKASQYFEKQICSTPVWAREASELDPIQLLPTEMGRGSVGESVIESLSHEVQQELQELDRIDTRRAPQKPPARNTNKHKPEKPTSSRVDSSKSPKSKEATNHANDTVQIQGEPDGGTSEISEDIARLQIKLNTDSEERGDVHPLLVDDLAKTIAEVCLDEVRNEAASQKGVPSGEEISTGKDSSASNCDELLEQNNCRRSECHTSDSVNGSSLVNEVELFSTRSEKSAPLETSFPEQNPSNGTDVSKVPSAGQNTTEEQDSDICDKQLKDLDQSQPSTRASVSSSSDDKHQRVFVTEVDVDFKQTKPEKTRMIESETAKEKTIQRLKSVSQTGSSSRGSHGTSSSDEVQLQSKLEGLRSKVAAMKTTQRKTQLLTELLDRRQALIHDLEEVHSTQDALHKSELTWQDSRKDFVKCDQGKLDSKPRRTLTACIDDYSVPNVQKKNPAELTGATSSSTVKKSGKLSKKPVPNISKTQKTSRVMKFTPAASEKPVKKLPKETKISILDRMRQTLLAWKTSETVKFLQASDRVKTREGFFEEKYAELCRRVDAQDLSDMIDEEAVGEELQKGKLPSMKDLERDAKDFEYRVKEFYGSAPQQQEQTVTTASQKKQPSKVGIAEKIKETPLREIVLPPVDSLAQHTHRRKIVLDKLSRVFPEMLGPIRITIGDISAQLKQLIRTFNLTSTNILLKPAEWTVMAYFLLKLLSTVNCSLKSSLQTDLATHYFRTMLLSLNISESDVTAVLDMMCCDIDID